MLIIGCDFHPGFQQVAIFDNRTGEIQEKRLQHREEAEQFYVSLAGQEVRVGMEACGHYPWFERLLEELGSSCGLGMRRRCGPRWCAGRRRTGGTRSICWICCGKNRFPRIWVPSLEVRDVRQLLVHRHKQVQARTRTKNQLQAMALSHGVQKKRKLWTQGGAGGVGAVALAAVRGGAAEAVAGSARRAGSGDRRTGPASGGRSAAAAGGGAVDDASGSGPGDGVGDGADAGAGGEVRIGQASGQLFRPDSERRIQRRKTAAGQDQQTGQFVSALFAGGSGTDGGAVGSATEALLSPPGGAQKSQRRQGGGGQKVGHAVVPDVARRLDVRATVSGRHAGKPESFRGRPVRAEHLSGQPASLRGGEIEVSNRGSKSRRDGWWDLKSPCRIEYSDELGLDIKDFLRERNGAAFGVDVEVSPKFA